MKISSFFDNRFNVDQVYDFLVSIGMKPYVELSFMPELIASGNETIMHYKGNITPPKNWADWYNLIVEFENHLISRYGLDEVSTWNQGNYFLEKLFENLIKFILLPECW